MFRRDDGGSHDGRFATSCECELVKINFRQLAENMFCARHSSKFGYGSAVFGNPFLDISLKCADQLIGIRVRQRL